MLKYKIILLVTLLTLFLVAVVLVIVFENINNEEELSRDTIVTTDVGVIRGRQADDGDYAMFLGIPYARVDETNPFGPSTPHEKFEEEFAAFYDVVKCPQMERNIAIGSLDCLQLNVYVPNSASSENRLPVMVFLHGGAFEIGHAGRDRYGPKFLVRHDVILVVVNYRLGPYGLMCLNTASVPGNQALKDQVIALRWVKDNIAAFGGDNEQITVFGESAGAVSVDLHLLSPHEKLFNKILMQSGVSISGYMLPEPDINAPLKICERLGFSTTILSDALAYLSTANATNVVRASFELGLLYSPCVEQNFNGVERLIEDYPINIVPSIAKVRDMPVLIGYNNNEMGHATANPGYYNNLHIIADRLRNNFEFSEEELNTFEEIIRQFYIGDEEINANVMWELIDFGSDYSFNHPVERTINFYLSNAVENVYYYVYSYSGGRDFFKDYLNITGEGAVHADELGYLFDMAQYGVPTPEDQLIIDRMTRLWTNFAKYSNPTPEITELLPVKWEPVTEDSRYYIDIDTNITVGRRPFHQRMAFWDLFYMENWKMQKGYR